MKVGAQTPTPERYYYEPPEKYGAGKHPSLFLAGGITGCPDWQSEVRSLLDGSGIVIFNPRRAKFPMDDPTAAQAQITWEYYHLIYATSILFWFCAETIQPIVLYELGCYCRSAKSITVGAHPDYPRREDVVVQCGLARPQLQVLDSLEATVEAASRPLIELIEIRAKQENADEFYNH